jgi:hypothetical protein
MMWILEAQLVFVIKCELVYKEMEDFLGNRNLKDVHTDQFSISYPSTLILLPLRPIIHSQNY